MSFSIASSSFVDTRIPSIYLPILQQQYFCIAFDTGLDAFMVNTEYSLPAIFSLEMLSFVKVTTSLAVFKASFNAFTYTSAVMSSICFSVIIEMLSAVAGLFARTY